MSWHSIKLGSKIIIIVLAFGAGFGAGFGSGVGSGWKTAAETIEPQEGNTLEVNVDAGKMKDGSTLDLGISDIDQDFNKNEDNSEVKKDKSTDTKKKKWWNFK